MGRLKDLETQVIELEKQVDFYKSWLEADGGTHPVAKESVPDSENKKLREELSAAKATVTAKEQNLAKLKKDYDELLSAATEGKTLLEQASDKMAEAIKERDAMTAEIESLKDKLAKSKDLKKIASLSEEKKALQESLVAAHQDIARMSRTIGTGARRWNYIMVDDPKLPKTGQQVLVCCVSLVDMLKQLAHQPKSFRTEFLIRDAIYRENRDFDGCPDGNCVIAWQSLVEPDWERLSVDSLLAIDAYLQDPRHAEKDLEGMQKKDPVKYAFAITMVEGARKALERNNYINARDRVGRDLLFKAKRNGGKEKV